jgi:hypothetical protein
MAILDGGELGFADFDEHLQGRTSDSRLPKPPLLDSLFGNEIGSEAHLPGHSKVSGMACSDDARGRQC